MAGLLGEYLCRLDSKGRIKVPAGLKKQLNPANDGKFVINRGFEQHLALYPFDEWSQIDERLDKLNSFKKENRLFVRAFKRGATVLTLDSADRLLLPKRLLGYAGVSGECLLATRNNVIDIWDAKVYDEVMNVDSDDFADLAERVMGEAGDEIDLE